MIIIEIVKDFIKKFGGLFYDGSLDFFALETFLVICVIAYFMLFAVLSKAGFFPFVEKIYKVIIG